MPTFLEFFAGGGMARLGLGRHWTCLFANDIDEMKASAYRANFHGAPELRVGDVNRVVVRQLPAERADLAWASFPCQDLSLAGAGRGLNSSRSGTFWPFWRLIVGLRDLGRAPAMVVLENVYGALTSHEGRDFSAIGNALADAGYRFGALVIDAAQFVPQSRPRLFVLGIRHDLDIPDRLQRAGPDPIWHPQKLLAGQEHLSPHARDYWLWWRLRHPAPRWATFADIIEPEPQGVSWHTPAETQRLLDMMSPGNRAKVEHARTAGGIVVGGVYKRIRKDGPGGQKTQRAEVRFDDLAGCLRTPTGGSGRQTVMIVQGDQVRSRLLSPREAARLMGIPDRYQLPHRYNDAYYIAGDGVVVPVVRHLARHLIEPTLRANG